MLDEKSSRFHLPPTTAYQIIIFLNHCASTNCPNSYPEANPSSQDAGIGS